MEDLKKLAAILDEAATMRNAYFFRPPHSAGQRRSYERFHSHDKIEWYEGGHHYTAQYVVSCSCSNVRAYGIYTRDDQTCNLTVIKNSYRRLAK